MYSVYKVKGVVTHTHPPHVSTTLKEEELLEINNVSGKRTSICKVGHEYV